MATGCPSANSILPIPNDRVLFVGGYGVVLYDGKEWSRPNDDLLVEASCAGGTIDSARQAWLATRNRGVLQLVI